MRYRPSTIVNACPVLVRSCVPVHTTHKAAGFKIRNPPSPMVGRCIFHGIFPRKKRPKREMQPWIGLAPSTELSL